MAQPLRNHVQWDLPDHQPMPGSTVPQGVGTRASLPSPWRFLVETSPLDSIGNVPQRRPHSQRNHLVPRHPVCRPVRKELGREGKSGRVVIKLCHRSHPLAHLLLFKKTRI